MAMTALGTMMDFPSSSRAPNSAFGVTHFTINAAGEKGSVIVPLSKAGTIAKIGVHVALATTPETIRVSLQTLDADGHPSGTLFGGSAAGTQAAPATGTAYTITLGTGATVGAGDVGKLVAVVVEFDSAVGDVRLTSYIPNSTYYLPYGDAFTGSWAKNTSHMSVWLEYSDGSYADIFIAPIVGNDRHQFNLNTAGADEYGLALQSPVSMRAVGMWAFVGVNAAADFEAILYDGTSALKTIAVDGDHLRANSTITQTLVRLLFESPQTLAANTEYIPAIRATTANTVTLRYVDFPSTAAMAAWGGSNLYQKSRLDQGAWGDSLLRRPMVGLIIDAVDIPAGGGGGETFTGSKFNQGLN